MENFSKPQLLNCIEEIAKDYSMTTKELLETVQNSNCSKDYKSVYPENPIILEKDSKTYVTNLKCMLAENLYDSKTGNIIKIQPKNLKLLDIGPPPVGWWVSEKLDGIRAIWDGEKFLSRNSSTGLGSKVFSYVPQFILDAMPAGVALDGEIWKGRNQFNDISSISNLIPGSKFSKEQIDDKWRSVKYKVFDIPNSTLPYEERMKELDKIELNLFNCNNRFVEKVKSVKIKNPEHLQEIYYVLTKDGAEGVMLRAPNSPYEYKRSKYLLKYKIKDDAEGLVILRIEGTGRLKNLMGSLRVELIKNGEKTGIFTNIGTGFTDEQRTNDPKSKDYIPVGSIVSFSYMELTEDSVRHPAFRGVRHDVVNPVKKEKLNSYNDYIVVAIRNSITDIERTKEPNWQFRRKQYLKALEIFTKAKDPIKTTDDAISLLRQNGMKLEKEEEYYKKNKEYKSSILKQVDYLIKTGDLPDQSDESKAIMNLSKIPEIGEAKSRKLYEEYGVVTVAELRKLYETDKSVLTQKQATGLKYLEDLSTRIPRDEMTDWNMLLYQVYLEVINEVEPEKPDFIMVGSYRRKAVSSGDIDILITSDNKGVDMMKLFKEKLLEKGIIESSANIFAAGDTKIMAVVKLKDTYRHLDIFYHPRDIYPFAILHSTGSADFNAELRSFFISKGYSLSEKGIKRGSPKGPSVVSTDIQPKLQKPRIEEEKDIFKFIGIPFIEPEKRTGGINFEKISTQ